PNLSDALFARAGELERVDIVVCAPGYDPGWFEPGHPAFQMHVEVFNSALARPALVDRRIDFISVPFSRRFKNWDERGSETKPADTVLISISPPDENGFCSFGLSAWNKRTYVRRAGRVIAEIRDNYPMTGGTNQVHVTELDAIVPGGEHQFPVASRLASEETGAIAASVRELVNDGDTIQIGTGRSTAWLAVNGAFDGKEGLGVHSEISVPGMNEMVMSGQITGEKKTLHPGKYVATALIAMSLEELEFIDRNPIFEVYDVDYTNDPRVIAKNDNMVAINNAVAVDLTGQVASESLGRDMWSGPGGQFEFAMGAMLSRGGRSITVLPSTARDGEVSRIAEELGAGAIVTVPRQIVDYVVTEYGVASLYDKTDRERAAELISIAHPDHRKELRLRAAEFLGLAD
ncbi:MAG TPA: acetyl-CoA hydrolase/transferase C-terminal domain-containing protein, partial [Dehalococcoidia bacterium]|nr:acetyl-CoA hydrolase/transferase C-terminal domain-containing protein [Dehalococcoidia bacterium]